MRVTVFTSNQPRHTHLMEILSRTADEVFAVQECTTLFPGEMEDFYKKTEIMQGYFRHVLRAEEAVFGRARLTPPNVRTLPIKMGDLNHLDLQVLKPALESDVYVVFGASFIKGPLCDFLVAKGAYNIHMGVSPYYRGNSCNFWALYDGRPEFVGATIHLLTKGLDSGPMLFHALPSAEETDGFRLGMRAVKAAHVAFADALREGALARMAPAAQDRALEFRYTRMADFTDEVASRFLARPPSPREIHDRLSKRPQEKFLRPRVVAED